MDFVKFDLSQLELVPKAYAQGLDGLAQPTFGTLEIGDGSSSLASLLMTASSTQIRTGQQFSVDVEIRTGSFTINEYRIVLSFNRAALTVVDFDPSTPGTQIEMLDTVFTIESGQNISDNNTGKITLIAKTTSGNALQVNRKVARIKFQAQAVGGTTIQPTPGVDGTQLINQNGVAIPSSLNSLTVTITTQAQTSSSSSSVSSSSSATSSVGSTSSSTSSAGGGQLPATGLGEDLIAILPILIGILLISLGVSLTKPQFEPHRDE